uniref:Uncharacterized protein n=1 Tax=Anguilla anguilla TaxID=7936 RepID=A0A0E9TKD9_ANGAN
MHLNSYWFAIIYEKKLRNRPLAFHIVHRTRE